MTGAPLELERWGLRGGQRGDDLVDRTGIPDLAVRIGGVDRDRTVRSEAPPPGTHTVIVGTTAPRWVQERRAHQQHPKSSTMTVTSAVGGAARTVTTLYTPSQSPNQAGMRSS